MKIEMLDLTAIKEFDHNPRAIPDSAVAAVARSIQEFGFLNPCLLDKDNVLIAGHTRTRAARKLGMAQVPCIRVEDLTPAQVRAFRVADNQLASLASFDPDLLRQEIVALQAEKFDIGLLAFPEQELAKILSGGTTGGLTDPDDVPEPPKEVVTKTGDLIVLGPHRLLCGNSANPADVARVMDGRKADLIFTDPPYGVSIGAKNRLLNSVQKAGRNLADIVNDDLSPEDLKAQLLPAFINAREAMSESCTVFVTAPQGGGLGMMMMMMMMTEAGLPARHVLIWKKNSPTFSVGRLDYDYQHEPILMTWGKRHNRYRNGPHQTSVWEIDKPRESKICPSMKPVALMVNAILNHTLADEIVLDIYAGSGSTCIACNDTGRRCRMIEIDPSMCDAIVQRWELHAGGKAVRPARIEEAKK
jgi:DNA modification methylase